MSILTPKIEGSIAPKAVVVINNADVVVPAPAEGPVSRAKELLTLHHSISNGMNFELANEIAMDCMDDIFEHWLPDGEYKNHEYVACNPTRDDGRAGSFKVNTETGLWADFATQDSGGDLISLVKYLDNCTYQGDAAVKILEFIAGMQTDDGAPVVKQVTARKAAEKPAFTTIMPIPEEAARTLPVFFGVDLGTPTANWTYRNASGQTMFYVLRFDLEAGKQFRQLRYCEDSSGWRQWRLGAPPAPRPAYGLDRLAARPDAPVLFAEGEKSADAAQRLFPDFVAATTMNGSKSPGKTDFTPFAGRKIYIAQDNDDAGTAYKDKLIQLLRAVGADVMAVMRLDPFAKDGNPLPKSYDLADAEADGWTVEQMTALGDGLWEAVSPVDPLPPAPASTPAATPTRKKDDAAAPKKKTPLDLAKEFATQNYGGNVAYFNNQILAYASGYWAPLNPDVEVKQPILNAIGPDATAAKINGVFELFKIQYAALPEKYERRSALICLNNGTLDPITGELLPHSVDHFLTNKMDIGYDRQALCPLWVQTLDEIFSPDFDKAEKVRLLQEFIGYCLIPDTRIHKFLWMVGSGRNGKSLILGIITALIGKINISYAPIERLEEKFVRAELQGKLVNISSEMSAQATVADGYLKQITAGDIIEAERKNERPFSFKPYARLIGATNTLPRLLDHSDGFFCRAMILRFNRQFKVDEQDKQREARLMAELPGILNWAVTGLQNLLQRGDFLIPPSCEAEVSQYRVNSDPVRQFAEEFLRKNDDENRWAASGVLYEIYKAWSGANGYKSLASNQFAERLTNVGFVKDRRKAGRYWHAEYCEYPTLHNVPAVQSTSPLASKYSP